MYNLYLSLNNLNGEERKKIIEKRTKREIITFSFRIGWTRIERKKKFFFGFLSYPISWRRYLMCLKKKEKNYIVRKIFWISDCDRMRKLLSIISIYIKWFLFCYFLLIAFAPISGRNTFIEKEKTKKIYSYQTVTKKSEKITILKKKKQQQKI